MIRVALGWMLAVLATPALHGQSTLRYSPATMPDTIVGAVGAEDIDIDPETGIAFISSDNRRANMAGDTLSGAIYAYHLADESPRLRHLTGNFREPFHPHGISLYINPEGERLLFVINHKPDADVVEVFKYTGTELQHLRTIASPDFYAPNDIYAVNDTQFYCTIDRGSRGNFARFWEYLLRLPKAYVSFYDGNQFSKAGRKLRYANGINGRPDKNILYTAEVLGGRVTAWVRNPKNGQLARKYTLKLRTGADNIALSAEGELYIAAHPRLMRFLKRMNNPEAASPWEVFVLEDTGDRLAVKHRLYNQGKQVGGASVAAPWGNLLLIGTVFDPVFLVGPNPFKLPVE